MSALLLDSQGRVRLDAQGRLVLRDCAPVGCCGDPGCCGVCPDGCAVTLPLTIDSALDATLAYTDHPSVIPPSRSVALSQVRTDTFEEPPDPAFPCVEAPVVNFADDRPPGPIAPVTASVEASTALAACPPPQTVTHNPLSGRFSDLAPGQPFAYTHEGLIVSGLEAGGVQSTRWYFDALTGASAYVTTLDNGLTRPDNVLLSSIAVTVQAAPQGRCVSGLRVSAMLTWQRDGGEAGYPVNTHVITHEYQAQGVTPCAGGTPSERGFGPEDPRNDL